MDPTTINVCLAYPNSHGAVWAGPLEQFFNANPEERENEPAIREALARDGAIWLGGGAQPEFELSLMPAKASAEGAHAHD